MKDNIRQVQYISAEGSNGILLETAESLNKLASVETVMDAEECGAGHAVQMMMDCDPHTDCPSVFQAISFSGEIIEIHTDNVEHYTN